MAKKREDKEAPNIMGSLATIITPPKAPGKLSDWILEEGLTTPKGRAYEFTKHKFLRDLADDWNPSQASPKGAQMGLTEIYSIKALFACKHREWNIIYTLPSDDDVSGYVNSKFNMIIERNKVLDGWIAANRSVSLKRVGNNFIYFRGTRGATEALTISSDLNIYDECDKADQETLRTYESRLGDSEYKGQWYLSNLSAPGMGVHAQYEKSDQKHWHIKCSHCNHEQFLSWPDSIEHELDHKDRVVHAQYICKKCKKPIQDEERSDGIWVPHETSNMSGYWLNHLMCSWHSASYVVEKANAVGGQAYFHNFVLGLPYKGSDTTVDRDTILKSRVGIPDEEWKHLPVAMGIDTGAEWHVVLGNEKGIFLQKVCDEREARRLIALHNPVTVIDLKGDPTVTRRLMKEYRGRLFGCDYQIDKADRETIRWADKEKFGVVYVDRTRIIDETIDDFTSGRLNIIKNGNTSAEGLEKYIRHWESLYKTKICDKRLNVDRDKWENHGADHFSHATVYFKVALAKLVHHPVSVVSDKEKEPLHQYEDLGLEYVIANQRNKRDTHWLKL